MHGSLARALLTLGFTVFLAAILPACSPAPVSVQINAPPAGAGSPPGPPSPPTPTSSWSCNFPYAPTDCGFVLQAAAPDRAMIVAPGRAGPTAVELTTEPGDINLFGSGVDERADLALPPSAAYCHQGQEEWWADSLMFPDGYVIPLAQLLGLNWGVVFDFHNTGGSGQANFQLFRTMTVAGAYRPQPLPPFSARVNVDGYHFQTRGQPSLHAIQAKFINVEVTDSHGHGKGRDHGPEEHEEPVVRDKRRIDPTT